ncbi:hypothetical protein [Vibrio renipiscarius]|uniref:Lipoprotein n=1 Tax=Vibrio renipiscarius TaxID=1461322 RepID=A0A0C2K9W1_9VIBR|nr:hypothetical protein [Vibrio renipiscarius]KII75371.1 hypothetical protein OJ16_18975 [Vibrio renipiscarius]KII78823.1 hypothetical protein PL18_11085 [Vibrio renipiscarius]
MKCIHRLALLSAAISLLVGCGGGSGSSDSNDGDGNTKPEVGTTLKGKAIDGYIIGATVFLDLNFNKVKDANEPSTITREEGDFDLNIPDLYVKCAQYVPLVVDVPVGAVDTDFPNTPIENAYSMVFPPQFALSTDQDLLNLTPLTSVVWKQVEQELRQEQTSALSCDTILAAQDLREDITRRLGDQEERVASRYNITVEELYGDYVESGDIELHQKAQALVPALQKSYEETKRIVDENPNADFAWVEYFYGEWDSTSSAYNDDWYRYEMVQTSNGNFNSVTMLMSDDLNTELSVFNQSEMTTIQRDGVNIEHVVHIEKSGLNEYDCLNDEWLETIELQSSGVRNYTYSTVQDWSSCKSAGSAIVTQSLVTKDHQDPDLFNTTEHVFLDNNDSEFNHLIGVSDTVTKADLTPVRTVINTDFYSEDAHGSDSWLRTRSVFSEDLDQPAQIMTSHDQDGQWTRFTRFHNGTHKNECGESEDSLSVEQCHATHTESVI